MFINISQIKVSRLIVILVFVLSCGCATMSPMALKKGLSPPDVTTKSIGMFTLKTSNQFKPSFQPSVKWLKIVPGESGKVRKFKVEKPYNIVKNQYYEYLISVDLLPDMYTIGEVMGNSSKIPFIYASFRFPLDAKFQLSPNTVAYLGHIEMINRKRNDGEPRSGPVIPLLDQAAAGYSRGTFDINISDRGEEDIPLFIQTYPSVEKFTIEKVIMTK